MTPRKPFSTLYPIEDECDRHMDPLISMLRWQCLEFDRAVREQYRLRDRGQQLSIALRFGLRKFYG